MAYLTINIEGKRPFKHSLDVPAIVGRARECDVWIDDSRLSREHCRFEPIGGDEASGNRWAVIDLNSTNGTMVGGQPVGFHELQDGDEVEAGRATITFHARTMPPQRPAKPTLSSSGDSSIPSMSDTLTDSRFPIPKPVAHSSRGERAMAVADRKSTLAKGKPLAFQRPPAQPKVGDEHDRATWIVSIWRRLRGSRQ